MKKTKIITAALGLCVMASMFAGCGNSGGSTGETGAAVRIEGGQTQISVEASASDAAAAVKGYSIKHNGYEFGIGSTEDTVITAMGEPEDTQEVANCADEGLGNNFYYYDGRVIVEIAAAGGVTQISVSDPIIDCGGVSVGDSADAVTAAYGQPDEQTDFIIQYKKEGMVLQFQLEGGKVTAIFYLKDYIAG